MARERTIVPRVLRAASTVSLLLGVLAGSARAAPRVGVVVIRHDGLTGEQAEEIAYDTAAAIAERIEGEAIAGSSVRAIVQGGVPAGCESRPACGRDLAAKLGTDEVLFLNLLRTGKRDVELAAFRVARDPERVSAGAKARLAGAKARRAAALSEMVAQLYPPGSVVPFVDPAAAPASDASGQPEPGTKRKRLGGGDDQPGPPFESITKKRWFWPVVVGGAVLVVGGIIAITIVETRPGPTGAPVTLP